MAAEPKKRRSSQRQGKIRATIKIGLKNSLKCSNCGTAILPHVVCKNCGFYKGKQVIKVDRKAIVTKHSK